MIYFVSPTGSDSYPGTADEPFATIQKGADTAVSMDTVIIEPGVYREQVTLNHSGAYFGRMIRFEGAGPEYTIIDAGDFPDRIRGIFDTAGQDYLAISGIGVRNGNGAGFSISGSWQVTIENCRSFNTTDSGIKIDKSGTVRVKGCEVEKACQHGGEESISVKRSQDVEIDDCHIHDTGHEGIDVKEGSKHVRIIGNHIHGTQAQGLYAEAWDSPTFDIRFENNIVHDCMFGMAAGSECGGELSDVWFVNNLVYNNSGPGMIAADWGDERFTHPVKDVHFLNNTVVGNFRKTGGWDGGMVFENTEVEDIEVAYNILADNGEANMRITQEKRPASWNIHDNLFFGPGEPMGQNALVADPEFIDAAINNFKLKAESPAMERKIGWRVTD